MTDKKDPAQIRGYGYGELHTSQESLESAKRELDKAKLAYQRLTAEEMDPFRKEQLANFHEMAMKTANISELDLVKEMAFRTAEETRALKIATDKKNRIRIMVWIVGIVAAATIVATGFQKIYYYEGPNGILIESATFEGPKVNITVAKKPITVKFHHEGYAFSHLIVPRVIALFFLVILFVYLSLSKTL